MADLSQVPVNNLRGVGATLSAKLARLGISSLQDLLMLLPRDYQNRTQRQPLGALQPGQTALVQANVVLADVVQGRRRSLLVRLRDGTGGITLRFYHFHKAMIERFQPGQRIQAFGEIRPGPVGLEMIHPELEWPSEGDERMADGLTPIYPLVDGLTQKRLRELIQQALPRLAADDALQDSLAEQHASTWSVRAAIRFLHAPPADADAGLLRQGRHPAQQQLIFEELLAHQLRWREHRQQQRQRPAPILPSPDALTSQLLAALPFALTDSQQRVLTEIRADLAKPYAMLRLLQGDVGAGKTVVGALSACPALSAGLQVALMAPTEILAEQHRQRFSQWFEPLGIQVGWLTGKLAKSARQRQLDQLKRGECQLIVGTHALFQADVEFAQLGLVLIDEQHRFGVAQRLTLAEKSLPQGHMPHQLIMTATPIPRTLAMSQYGDLTSSIIDGLPPGRQAIQTLALANTRRDELMQRIDHHVAKGQQVYWVCTLIENHEQIQAQAAEAACESLSSALPHRRIGLLHGQMKSADKAAMMERFSAGEIDVLVATTVIEVGVDVPNATLMVIENPERLGLSQLHQLRGRVGRGHLASFCVLLYQAPLSAMAKARLDVMRESQDGFFIAERDLELRGPGEMLGTKQTGDVSFHLAQLPRDEDILLRARQMAMSCNDPQQLHYLYARWLLNRGNYAHA